MNKTQEQPNQINQLQVYRDGEQDMSYVRAAQRAQAADMLRTATGTVLRATGRSIVALVMPTYLDLQDGLHGTDMRAEYFERKREAATEMLRQVIKL